MSVAHQLLLLIGGRYQLAAVTFCGEASRNSFPLLQTVLVWYTRPLALFAATKKQQLPTGRQALLLQLFRCHRLAGL